MKSSTASTAILSKKAQLVTQIGESVATIFTKPNNEAMENCIFCGKDHQDEKPAAAHTFPRDMPTLKQQGRIESRATRLSRYPGESKAPLVEWSQDIKTTGGYKAAAHHCIALEVVNQHPMSGELNAAGYDPNRGTNCIWLPLNRPQFIRARAYSKAMQIHRGGHTNQYYETVKKRLDRVAEIISIKFCTQNQKASKEHLLRYMLQQENALWLKVASASDPAYRLYAKAFLNPRAPWGHYDEEKDTTPADYLATGESDPVDEARAQAENS